MTIYELRPLDGIEIVNSDGKEARNLLLRGLDGTPLAASWPTPPVRLASEDERGRPLTYSDMPFFGGGSPILRAAARDVVQDLPGQFELLPLRCAESELYVLNATCVLDDAIDEEVSGITRIPTGKVTAIKHPAFRPAVVADAPIFRLAQLPTSNIYFSETWVRALSSLSNVELRPIWNG